MPAVIEPLGYVLAAILLVLSPLTVGGILYVLGKDFIKRNIGKPD